jgi:hypothetical protein
VFIPKGVKVLCFDTLLQVFILKNLHCTKIVHRVLSFVGGDPEGSPEWVLGVQFMQKYSTTMANCQGILLIVYHSNGERWRLRAGS